MTITLARISHTVATACGVAILAATQAPVSHAADLPLDDQIPVELTLSEQALRDAGARVATSTAMSTALRSDIARCEALLSGALNDLRAKGGGNAADGLSEIPGINDKIQLARALAKGAEAGGVSLANVTREMGPSLRAIEKILRDLRDKKEQLTQVDAGMAQAVQDLKAAQQRVTAEQAQKTDYLILPSRDLMVPIRLRVDGREIDATTPKDRVAPEGDGGFRYLTPRFGGFDIGGGYTSGPPSGPGTTTPPPTGYSVKPDFKIGGELSYTLGKWSIGSGYSYAEKPSDSGVERTSQAEVAQLGAISVMLGDLAFPSDRFFNRRGSWGQPFEDQWALRRIGFEPVQLSDMADSLWPKAGRPVIVAVLDTGVDRGHPELAGRIALNRGEAFGDKTDNDGNGFIDDVFGWNFITNSFDTWDDNGHGTFVAGIIAARVDNGLGIAGVNPYAMILPVKVTDHRHASGSRLIAKGIRYAVDRGARVINISIGGPTLTADEDEAVRYAISKDVLVVAAAGNLGVDTANFGPAGTGGVITVAATDQDDKRAGYSNFGVAVDISAPGDDILSLRAIETDMIAKADKSYKAGSAFVGGVQDYYRASGTSFAAPLVSGVASLIMAKFPNLTGEQVKRMILNSARDIDVPGIDRNTGYGLIDARAALATDPSFFIDAQISGVSLANAAGARVVRVAGTADADKFAGARVEIGAGDSPAAWTRIGNDLMSVVRAGDLAEIPVSSLGGSRRWTIRIVVRHENGREREARYVLNLG